MFRQAATLLAITAILAAFPAASRGDTNPKPKFHTGSIRVVNGVDDAIQVTDFDGNVNHVESSGSVRFLYYLGSQNRATVTVVVSLASNPSVTATATGEVHKDKVTVINVTGSSAGLAVEVLPPAKNLKN